MSTVNLKKIIVKHTCIAFEKYFKNYLYEIIDDPQRDEQKREPWQSVAGDDESSQKAIGLSEKYIHDERKGIVDGVKVARETIDNPTNRRDIKEADRSLKRKYETKFIGKL